MYYPDRIYLDPRVLRSLPEEPTDEKHVEYISKTKALNIINKARNDVLSQIPDEIAVQFMESDGELLVLTNLGRIFMQYRDGWIERGTRYPFPDFPGSS